MELIITRSSQDQVALWRVVGVLTSRELEAGKGTKRRTLDVATSLAGRRASSHVWPLCTPAEDKHGNIYPSVSVAPTVHLELFQILFLTLPRW